MVYRNSWLAGLAAFAFAFAQLNALIFATETGVPWQYAAAMAMTLGAVITWTALTYRLKTWLVVVINAAAGLLAVVRVVAPETTRFFLPTGASFTSLNEQLKSALHLIRTGVEPVVPEAGVVVVVMVVLWVTGGMLSWGLLRGHPYVALVPPLVLAVEFTVMDRRPTPTSTIIAFVALVGLIIFAVTSDERDQTSSRMAPRGVWTPPKRGPAPAASLFLVATMALPVVAVGVLDGAVPDDGILNWRVNGPVPAPNFGEYGASDSYNPFIGIHQQLVSNGTTVRFMAGIESTVPAGEVYFQFVTMEHYDGDKFSAVSSEVQELTDGTWEHPDHTFAGPTENLASIVAIDQLRMPWLPVPATPWSIRSISPEEFDVYLRIQPEDGSVLYQGGTTARGMRYQVNASIPEPDISVLATKPDITDLSVVFRTAIEEGALLTGVEPLEEPAAVRLEPPEPDRFLDLPVDDPSARIAEIEELAREQTARLETDFEKGLALEAWLRTFEYTTDIVPDQAADDLSAWLLDEDSNNYHRGYCENFATAMAVMARTLGIHSRVVLGFTPGDPHPLQPGVVLVRDRNAHAWVELWMPSQGWVRFDPTPRPDSVNPSTTDLIAADLDLTLTDFLDIAPPESTPQPSDFDPSLFEDPIPDFLLDAPIFLDSGAGVGETPSWVTRAAIAALVLALVATILPAFKIVQRRRRLKRLRSGDIGAAWEDIVARLADLGRPASAALTPRELAESVDDAMVPLAAVYGRVAYGPGTHHSDREAVHTAEAAMAATHGVLNRTSSRRARIVAAYRPRTMSMRRRRRR